MALSWKVAKNIDNVTGSGAILGEVSKFNLQFGRGNKAQISCRNVQISNTANCGFALRGRMAPEAPWINIIGGITLAPGNHVRDIFRPMPEMQALFFGALGTYSCWIHA